MGVMHKNTASGGGVSNPAASAETVIYTTPTFMLGQGEGPVGISGTVNITPGTGCTAIIIRVRLGGLTGTLISTSPSHTVVAGSPQSISFGATDNTTFLQAAAGGAYVITAQQTGGTGAGTTNVADVEVIT